MGKWIDITSRTFGNMVALEYLGSRAWLVRCEHGTTFSVRGSALRSGETNSCRMHCPFCPAGHDTRIVGRYAGTCAECCRAASRVYYAANRDSALMRAAKYKAENMLAVQKYHRDPATRLRKIQLTRRRRIAKSLEALNAS